MTVLQLKSPSIAKPSHILSNWTWEKYRTQTFGKNEPIRTRPGLIYFILNGCVRLEANDSDYDKAGSLLDRSCFFTFIGKNRPFEVIERVSAVACVDDTIVSWFYPEHLASFPRFAKQIEAGFTANSRHQLRLLAALSQSYTIDKLHSWLSASIAEFGIDTDYGRCLPFPINHAQIASAIGTTRVTVTRTFSVLKKRGEFVVIDRSIYLSSLRNKSLKHS